MDTILAGLTVFGLAALMGGALCYSVYHALTRTLPELVAQHRQGLSEQRDRYHQLLTTEQETFRAALEHVVRSLESLQHQIEEQSRQMAGLTAVIQRCDVISRAREVDRG